MDARLRSRRVAVSDTTSSLVLDHVSPATGASASVSVLTRGVSRHER